MNRTSSKAAAAGAAHPRAGAFIPPSPPAASLRLASGWLWLGMASLVGAGLFAVLLVLSRTPYVQDIFPWVDFFHSALVVHVDLSVLFWFLAFAGVIWSFNASARWIYLGWPALALATAGALIVAAAPFVDSGKPIMSNYIPVLQGPVFLSGLVLFAGGIAFLVLRSLVAALPAGRGTTGAGALRFGIVASLVAAAFALIAYAWSYAQVPDELTGTPYFELLFWGGGHVMQFSYTLLMLTAWLWLASASGMRLSVSPRLATLLLALGLLPVFLTPFIYLAHDIISSRHVEQFTLLMKVGGSLAAAPLGLAVAYGLLRGRRAEPPLQPLRAALISSLILFAVGGGISLMIQGSNTIITAHYHGTGGAVSLAFMGLTYYLLPVLGYRAADLKWARIQPYVYGAGQLLHIIGLLWSGGYGVQRKVAGAAQELHTIGQKAGMGLMGLGGLIAVIGGLMFLVVVFRAMRRPAGR